MNQNASDAGLPASYSEVFRRFDDAGGKWVPTWNWSAFLAGIFWFLYRGLWLKAIIYFVGISVLTVISGGILAVPLWILGGVAANYDLYLLRRKGTPLWDGAGVAQNAVPGVTGPGAGAATPSARRKEALDTALARGVITQAEYDQKLTALQAEIEREERIAALDGMLRSGLISRDEYDARKYKEVMGGGVA